MSYRHAWNLIEKWAEFFGTPLVERRQGRGTALTTFGERLVWAGQRLQVLAQPVHRSARSAPVSQGLPLKDLEAALIRKAVDDARGNVMDAARALGISRATIYRKLGAKRR